MIRVLALAGSLRDGSLNKQLVRLAAAAAERAGAKVTLVDLRDFPMPLYDGDEEAKGGLPKEGKRLRDLFLEHDSILLSAPEYNSSISGVLKNAIDWVSRPLPQDAGPLVAFQGKVAAVMSASMGGWGGLRGLVHVRAILENMGVFVIPDQVTISSAHEKFSKEGQLMDKALEQRVESLARALVSTSEKLKTNY